MKYAHIAQEVFNTPMLLAPNKLKTITDVVLSRMNGAELQHYTDDERRHAGYEVIHGTALINVFGTMVHRADWMDAASGLTGYNFIRDSFLQALDDDDVQQIGMIYETPGGMVAGAFDLAELIYESRGIKPITSIISDYALSAGYLLASAGDEIVSTKTGQAGSVGVVMAHVDQSKFDSAMGVKVTYIFAGEHKVDGNPHEPLSSDTKSEFQKDIDAVNDLFISAVSKYRGLSEQEVRDTQAQIYFGKEALSIGFIDRISSEDKELTRLFGLMSGAGSRLSIHAGEPAILGADTMSKEIDHASDNGELEAAKTQAKHEGAQEERKRIQTILTHVEAEGRTTLAQKLAFTTDMTPEAAAEILATAEKHTPNQFVQLMDKLDNPEVGLEALDDKEIKVVQQGWDKAFSIGGNK